MTDSDREYQRGAFGPHVRIVCKPAYPPSCDLVVQVRDETVRPTERPGDTGWAELGRYNDMSDDYAYTRATERALAARRALLEGEKP